MIFKVEPRVKRSLSRRKDVNAGEAQAAFDEVRSRALHASKGMCKGCGFTSRLDVPGRPSGGLEVHHIDDDHHNNDLQNLVVLCPFCHAPLTLGNRGGRFSMKPAWLPEVEQYQISRVSHLKFFLDWLGEALSLPDEEIRSKYSGRVLEIKQDKTQRKIVAEASKAASLLFNRLENEGEKRLREVFAGEMWSLFRVPQNNPDGNQLETLYTLLTTLPRQHYEARSRILYGLRLIPIRSAFEKEIAWWGQNVWLHAYSPAQWLDFAKQVRDALKVYEQDEDNTEEDAH